MGRQFFLSVVFVCSLVSSNCWAGGARVIYRPNGDESAALMTQIHRFNQREDFEQSKDAYLQIQQLAEEGDEFAFSFITAFNKLDKDNKKDKDLYERYVNNTLLKLKESQNFTALGKAGKILLDLDDPYNAGYFLEIAYNNKYAFEASVEDLEYNYLVALCGFPVNKIDDVSKIYKRVWTLLKPHLSRTKISYECLFTILLDKTKENNCERLINKIGHYLATNLSNSEFQHYYINTFAGTSHLERLFRQRNCVTVEPFSNLYVDGIEGKRQREERFIKKTHSEIRKKATIAVEAIIAFKDLSNLDPIIIDLLKNQEAKKFKDLNSDQQKIFGRFLIEKFSNEIFLLIQMDEEEYANKYLSSKFEKHQFLMEQVFPLLGRLKINSEQ